MNLDELRTVNPLKYTYYIKNNNNLKITYKVDDRDRDRDMINLLSKQSTHFNFFFLFLRKRPMFLSIFDTNDPA